MARASRSSNRASVGLVLGAGGVAGAAWHAGALAALADVGWDARAADLMIGTSAGSGTASILRLDVPPSDLLAGALGEPMGPVGAGYAEKAGPPVAIPSPEIGGRIPLPASPAMALRSLAAPWRLRPMKLAAGLLPPGRASTAFIGDRIRRTHEEPWPERPTWICAVRLADGERVVFGRDVDDAHIATAVEASSAIPAFFAPVEHDGHLYVDGGAHSPTNADLVADLGFDVVVVSSPMSGTADAIRRLKWTGGRFLHRQTLDREVAAVRDADTPVLVLQPDADVVDTIGPNAMDPSRRADVDRAAYDSVTAHLASGAADDRLALLT